MQNKERLIEIFEPVDVENKTEWRKFLQQFDNIIYWQPSAGFKLGRIYLKSNTQHSLFILTDKYPATEMCDFILNSERLQFYNIGTLNVTINELFELRIKPDLPTCFWENALSSDDNHVLEVLRNEYENKLPRGEEHPILVKKSFNQIVADMKDDGKSEFVGRAFYMDLSLSYYDILDGERFRIIYLFVDDDYFIDKLRIGLKLHCQTIS